MSYSFSVNAKTKAEAKEKIAAEFEKIVANQPPHGKDRDAAVAVACDFVDVLVDPAENQEIAMTVNGSLGWTEADNFTNASISVQARVATLTAA